MKGMTIRKAALACGGTLCGEGALDAELQHAVIDSRAVQSGDLFAALRGEKADGHDYIAAAFQRGAACCLAERRPAGETRPLILCDDVERALGQIAAAYRETLSLPVVGVSGSVGKTTAKEMIAAVLSQRLRVLKTEGNLNNQLGVPMTVSRLRPEHEAAVIELGISGFGEMREIAAIARPTIAVYTVIGHAHLEFLKDLDGVLQAKTEMLETLPDDAPVIVNGDDDKLRGFSCRQRKICFGLGENCEVRAERLSLTPEGHSVCEIVRGARRIPVRVPAFGRHMVYAALAAAAVGMELGLTDEEIARGIAAYETVGRRGAVTETGSLTLIDDSYNANPDACRSAIDSLLMLPGRHVCIFGDMLELGEGEREMHRALGAYAEKRGVELLLCCGPLAEEISRAGQGKCYVNIKELIEALPGLLHRGDAVLVKASRGMHFEAIAEAVKELRLKSVKSLPGLLLFDLDGTLLRSDKTISQETVTALAACREAGSLIGICTARSEENARGFTRELEPDVLITSGGALVQYRGEFVFRAEFSEEETRRLIDTARAVCGDDCEITIDTMSGHFWNYKIDPRVEDQSWGNSIYTDFSDFHGRCLKMCVEIFEPLKAKELQDRLGECDCVRFSDGYWYQFTRRGATKENAIREICLKCGIRLRDITAFGDDVSDMEMLKLCGRGIAMGNAVEAVKATADEVIGTNDAEGIAVWLNAMLAENGR